MIDSAFVDPLRIAFAASELAPYAKTGGLADVAASLPATLDAMEHDVRVFTPLHRVIDRSVHPLEPMHEAPITMSLSDESVAFTLYHDPSSTLPVVFIDCPRFFHRDGIYTNDSDEPYRYLFFSRAVIEACQRLGFAPDLFHVNDWQTALVPLLLKTTYAWDRLFERTRSLLTIHNLGYQGMFSSSVFDSLDVEDRNLVGASDLAEGRINFLKAGLMHAHALTTVSPTYAQEIQTEEHGVGLDGLLRERRADLVGILNGVDYSIWNPSTDEHIPFRYSRKSLWRKKKNKKALLEKLSLPFDEAMPLVGMVTRLTPQKGIELLFESLPGLLERGLFQLVVLGSGEAKYETFFNRLQQRFEDKICFYRGFNEGLAHWVEAASDLFLMPSRYEPCGLNQMYSLRYGTVPVVRKTGGLADSVQLFDPESGEGTGVVFEHYTSRAVAWALEAAAGLYAQPDQWRRLVENGMAQNFSWEHQAETYIAIYRRLLIH